MKGLFAAVLLTLIAYVCAEHCTSTLHCRLQWNNAHCGGPLKVACNHRDNTCTCTGGATAHACTAVGDCTEKCPNFANHHHCVDGYCQCAVV